MPRLDVDIDFFKRYAKLEKPIQTAVDKAIKSFPELFYAGQHLERLAGARDSRLRTIRITQALRGVVLAESADHYVLIDVVSHDRADRELVKRLFTINQVLGVLEVRDQRAIEALEPVFEKAARAAQSRLFDRFKDSDLTSLGISVELLPLVRDLISEPQLDVLATLIPPLQYDALVGLASGLSLEEVWQHVCQYLVDVPQEVDPNNLGAAIERTPDKYVTVSGPDELLAMLAEPFAVWRIFLHPRQEEIAYKPSYRGSVLVTGGAGTGKTVTAVHRAAFLARRYQDVDGLPPILLTTFTRNLADALSRQLDQLVTNQQIRSRIEVLNVDRLSHRIVSEERGGRLNVVKSDTLYSWFQIAARATDGEFSAAFLKREWEQVILGQHLFQLSDYLSCERRGRGRQLRTAARERAWSAISRVRSRLRDHDQQTHEQIADQAARLIRGQAKALYQHIIVDEGQDLHPSQWRLLRAAVAPGHDDLFIMADPNQRIYDNRVSLEKLNIRVKGRSRRLTISYRTTQEILSWSTRTLGASSTEGLDDEPDKLPGYRSTVHGKRPVVRDFPDREAELDGLVEQVRTWLADQVEPSAIGVAARTSQLAEHARRVLRTAGIPVTDAMAKDDGSLQVDTMHRMKGMEFRCVAVINADDEQMPLPIALTDIDEDPLSHQQDLQRERCLLFVAFTRARDELYVSHLAGHGSRFLPDATR